MGGVELVYSLSSSLKQAGLSTLALELPFESAVTVWNSTCHTQQDRRKGTAHPDMCWGEAQVSHANTVAMRVFLSAFVQALSDHVHCHFHLKLAVSETEMLLSVTGLVNLVTYCPLCSQ